MGPLDLGQPWRNRRVGGHLVSSQIRDAALCEIADPDPKSRCFGVIRPPVPPIVGMKVKKSGAGTGVIGSEITGVAQVREDPASPFVDVVEMAFTGRKVRPVGFQFLSGGDSGSLALLGNYLEPTDFGDRINEAIDRFSRIFGGAFRRLILLVARLRLTNAAVALLYATAPFGPAGDTAAIGYPMQDVLDDFGVVIVS